MLSVINNLNDRIRQVRKDNKMTRPVFANSLFISVSYLGELESGKKTPSDTLLLLIALRYAVDFNWLKKGNMEYENAIAEFTPPYGLPEDLTEILNKISFIYKEGNSDNIARIWGVINVVYQDVKQKIEAQKGNTEHNSFQGKKKNTNKSA